MKSSYSGNKEGVVATLTFQDALNYGALLQCYALQQSILKLGHSTEVLNYASEVIRLSNWPRKMLSASSLAEAAKILVKNQYLTKRKKSFDAFKKECLVLSKEVSVDSFSTDTAKYAKVIVGSDQVWNPILTHGDMNYFLKDLSSSTKKAAYAASIGLSSIPGDYATDIRALLSDYCDITVREETAAKVLGALTGKNIDVVCDPVMLLDSSEWEDVMEDCEPGDKPYILYYSLGLPDKGIVEMCRWLSSKKNCGLVVLHNSPANPRGCISDNSCDPRRWMRYLKDADTIVTPSFHGVCFSLIFRKNFICLKNQKNSDVSSRLSDLLERVGLRERCMGAFEEQATTGIDWARVTPILDGERTRGVSRLKSILEL